MNSKRGDTIIEVVFAFAILSMVVILSVGSMNNGIANSQANLEASMVRSEMDAQAEAIRFIHEAYVASVTDTSSKVTSEYAKVWKTLVGLSGNNAIDFSKVPCDKVQTNLVNDKTFVINVRNLSAATTDVIVKGQFKSADIYPRLVYGTEDLANYTSVFEKENATKLKNNEGIWDTIKKLDGNNGYEVTIQACWYATGRTEPTTLDTVVRLYDLGSNA